MADEHKQQAAALLAEADDANLARLLGFPLDMSRAESDEEYRARVERARQHQRDLRAEALVHAVLQVADELSLLSSRIAGR